MERRRYQARESERKLPRLLDEVVAEAMVRPRLHALDARALVDAPRRDEDVVRPERELAVSGLAREPDARLDESRAQARAARGRVDEQEPELRDRGRGPRRHAVVGAPTSLLVLRRDEEDAPHVLAVHLGDPATLAPGIVLRAELGVPAVLLRVQRAVPLHDPAEVPGPGLAQDDARGLAGRLQRALDLLHRR